MLNASLCNSSSWDVVGWTLGTWETLLCCSWTCSRIVCCLSNRVDNHLISSDWALNFSACWRCRCNRTDTCVWCAISSSTISTSKASWPLRAWASAESCRSEGLLCTSASCKPWALVTFCSHSLLNIIEGKCLQGTRLLGTKFHVFRVNAFWHIGNGYLNLPWQFLSQIWFDEWMKLCHKCQIS